MPTILSATDHCFHCLEPGSDDHPINALGLCQRCANFKRIRLLYKPRSDRPAWWPEHLERLADRARRRLPLFEEPNNDHNGNEHAG